MRYSGRYLDYGTLVRLNESSVNSKRSRNFHLDRLPVERDKVFPVALEFRHNDVEMRIMLLLNEAGATGFLDISFEEYAELPVFGDKLDVMIGHTHTHTLSA